MPTVRYRYFRRSLRLLDAILDCVAGGLITSDATALPLAAGYISFSIRIPKRRQHAAYSSILHSGEGVLPIDFVAQPSSLS